MSKTTRIALLAVALLAAASASFAANLLTNPGFETSLSSLDINGTTPEGVNITGVNAGWSYDNIGLWYTLVHMYANSVLGGYTGHNAVRTGLDAMVTCTGWTGYGSLLVWQDLSISGGASYDASIYVRTWAFTPAEGDIAKLTVHQYDLTGTEIGTAPVSSINYANTDWTKLQVGLQAAGNAVTARYELYFSGMDPYGTPGAVVNWDDASFDLVPEPGSLAALGSGILALAGFAVRRRKA